MSARHILFFCFYTNARQNFYITKYIELHPKSPSTPTNPYILLRLYYQIYYLVKKKTSAWLSIIRIEKLKLYMYQGEVKPFHSLKLCTIAVLSLCQDSSFSQLIQHALSGCVIPSICKNKKNMQFVLDPKMRFLYLS